ncbi:MAG: hypothetical protein HYT08_03225 [Candidatus Levybacteria bacterium]|nr:hypothetical protein [Candidatus Levybacteria bacterium]
MRKVIGFIPGLISLMSAPAAFAQGTNIAISPPQGSIGDVDISKIPQFIVGLLFVIGVVIAIAFLIYGGIKWILSGGDKAAVESARNHIVAAIVGLIIVVGAFVILNLVIRIITGQPFDLNNLCIPSLTNPTCQ